MSRLPRIAPDPDGDHRRQRARGRRRRRGTWLRRLALTGLTLGLLLACLPPLLVTRYTPPFSAFMFARHLENLAAGRGRVPLAHAFVPFARISPQLALAAVAGEDQKFPQHAGFDFEQMARALEEAGPDGAPRGASTISQQTAKNLFLWSGRSWLRKGLEAWYTFWLERLCGKRRILELYLNFAEFGPDLYGVEAAARHYFRRSAGTLAAEQSALLAAALPSPRSVRLQAPDPRLRARQRWILMQMRQLGGPAYLAGLR